MLMYVSKNQFWNNTEEGSGKFTKCDVKLRNELFFKITNTMSLVDYPLFSWVVVIHSLHVSSFLEAHHQEIILPVQKARNM